MQYKDKIGDNLLVIFNKSSEGADLNVLIPVNKGAFFFNSTWIYIHVSSEQYYLKHQISLAQRFCEIGEFLLQVF